MLPLQRPEYVEEVFGVVSSLGPINFKGIGKELGQDLDLIHPALQWLLRRGEIRRVLVGFGYAFVVTEGFCNYADVPRQLVGKKREKLEFLESLLPAYGDGLLLEIIEDYKVSNDRVIE